MGKKQVPNGSGEAVLFSFVMLLFMVYWIYGAVTSGAPIIFYIVGGYFLYVTLRLFLTQLKLYRQMKNNPDFYDYGEYSNISMHRADISTSRQDTRYCPYCGSKISHDFIYCPYCGRQLHS